MSLDCMPWGRPAPGKEAKWSKAMERLYRGRQAGPFRFWRAQILLEKISVDPGDFLGAPRVGRDKAADDFVLARKPVDTDDRRWLAIHGGRYIFELVTDRWPELRHFLVRPASDYVEPTSLYGRALEQCPRIVDEALVTGVWIDAMSPEYAKEYGNRLMAAASHAREGKLLPLRPPKAEPAPKAKLGGRRSAKTINIVSLTPAPATALPSAEEVMARLAATPAPPVENGGSRQGIGEQIEIVEAIGRWYVFWGCHGHPILASY